MKRNNTSFAVQATAVLRDTYKKYEELRTSGKVTNEDQRAALVLKYYQYFVRTLMTNPEFGIYTEYENGNTSSARGLLIYHKMGLGKTYLAAAVAMAMWDIRRPLLLAAKSLHGNFTNSIKKLIELLNPDKIDLQKKQDAAVAKFKFVSMDAYNMVDQVVKATTGKSHSGTGSLDNMLLIVDEAHNFFRAIINSADEKTNAKKFYNMIMEARNLRILFLTGTPASKDPFEFVPCFNMLAGWDLLPTHYDTFYKYYVDRAARKVQNRSKLANRLMGLVSYAGYGLPEQLKFSTNTVELINAPTREIGGFPEEKPIKIEFVEMGPDQYRQYLLSREKEDAEGNMSAGRGTIERLQSVRATLALPGTERDGGSTYYVHSRMLSNFAAPREEENIDVDLMSTNAFTDQTGPKISRIIKNLEKFSGPALIYSQFVDAGGLKTVARFLREAGYLPYKSTSNKSYAVISGNVDPVERTNIVNTWNSIDNKHGEIIRILLISKTGAEGLSLKYGRQVHILEPYWDKAREDQVVARFVRLGSHDDLPIEEREVQSFLYIATPNTKVFEGIPIDNRELMTIDMRFHEHAMVKYELNSDFRKLAEEISIECLLYAASGIKGCPCYVCLPTNSPLFHENAEFDLRLPDPCEPLSEEQIDAKEIIYEGEKYYYEKDQTSALGYRFYKYNKDLEAHVRVDPAEFLYMKLLELVN
jgi:hypothetical protein